MKVRTWVAASIVLAGTMVVAGLMTRGQQRAQAEEKSVDAAATARARAEVKMLDDLYKTAVVGITATYVDKQSDTPAAAVAKQVFAAMHKKGHHSARLIDATGKPKSKENVAETEFEKKAVKAMQDGKDYIDEVAMKDGKPVLRAATIVPAVMKQCVQCHGGKEGSLMGVLVYEVPIRQP